MADAATEFLLQNVQQLLRHHLHLIKDAENQVALLESNLRLFKAFLRDSTKKRRRNDEATAEMVRQIRDVVYEAEDIVDSFVTQAAETKAKNYFLKAFMTPLSLHTIAEQVQGIGSKVDAIYAGKSKMEFAALTAAAGDGLPEESEGPPQVRQENVIGLEDEAEKIRGYLSEETEQLDVISVIGMPGLGKTTLVGKIFRDPTIQYEFPTRIWVYVSQEFTKKDVFLAILKEFTRDEMHGKTDQELADRVAAILESVGKFLIVMDDVWTPEDWDKIKIALPRSNKTGKVLITSRHKEVAVHANHFRLPHELRFLTHEESWLLLRWEVFGKPECPPELEVHGNLIAKQCDGLPLAIVVIGGILVKKFSASNEMNAKINAWIRVSQSVNAYLNMDPERRMEKIIALSYDKLPYHLRACFLYMGMFPEDFEIPVWRLVRMWIAEGFIQQKSDKISLEETAESYLDDLIKRNLVRIDKMKPDGKVKTCRLHDMLRDFCRNEAGEDKENFLQEMKRTDEGDFYPTISRVNKYRRLCIHSNVLSFLSSKPFGPRVRSFVSFSTEDVPLPADKISAIPCAFKLLRVLDVKPMRFNKIPSDMFQLVHLRYIVLSLSLPSLPAAFSKLWNVETLIVDTTHRTLEIKADIWNMTQLRYLKTNVSTTLPKTGKSSKGGEKLQTLGIVSPQSCTEEVFNRAHNVKKLGIRGRLASLIDGKMGSFDSLGKLDSLEKMKLLNDVFPDPPSEGQLRCLPQSYKFPPKLNSLTLSDTYLEWSHMSVLGLLENLAVLKLKDNAFKGKSWVVADGGFRNLEIFHIGRTDLAVWEASAHHFPKLRHLQLHNCEGLLQVPLGLADIPTLQSLDLYRCKGAAASAKKIQDAKMKKQVGFVFKLSIFPAVE